MSNCVHDNGEYCEVLSDTEVKQPCLETPLCEDYKKIVRCKDCKYFMYGNGCILQAVDYSWEEQMYANDFCSRGERK